MVVLKACQYANMVTYLKNDSVSLWKTVNQCFQHVLPTPIFTLEALVTRMGAHANSLFWYCVLHFRNESNLEFKSEGCTLDNPLYRAVWLGAQNYEIQVLAKGPLWQNSIKVALAQGRVFTPNLDFIDNGSQPYKFLTLEQRCSCCPMVVEPNITLPSECVEVDKNKHFIKLSWKIFLEPDMTYHIYHLIEEDIWHYSASADIQAAYHEYMHM